ncbi:hypothetical protein PMZ80_003044 [Knufia obscura]|uniref:Sin3-associated polypeptide Sap18 n=2 Tax=Knufia TaxID=430999 RepID=A0AAN8ECW1_9EURO|nr:hypothetical protein PMZ80_003044 [Knufia obscura]KAK5952368.1 hypothetical protein OHC33_006411 [Knufia fluminis]
MSRSPSPQPQRPSSSLIDRQKTTPFLLHFCYRSNAFHSLSDFPLPTPSNPTPPLPAHLQMYTWMSCTLRELAHLLTTALPNVLPEPAVGTRLSFRLVFPDTRVDTRPGAGRLGGEDGVGRGRYTMKEVGSVVIGAAPSSNGHAEGDEWELGGEDSEKTLADARFVIGDFVDCAIFPPLSDGSVVPRGNTIGNRGGYVNGRGRGAASYGVGRGASIPTGEWRRGERLPGAEVGGFRGGGGYGRGGRRGAY